MAVKILYSELLFCPKLFWYMWQENKISFSCSLFIHCACASSLLRLFSPSLSVFTQKLRSSLMAYHSVSRRYDENPVCEFMLSVIIEAARDVT